MAKSRTRNRRFQSPKVRTYAERDGYKLVDRRSASSKSGFVGRWLRLVPAHAEGMPPAGPCYQVKPGPEHLGLRRADEPICVSNLLAEAQQRWADDAAHGAAEELLRDAEQRGDIPTGTRSNRVAANDLVRLGSEILDFVVSIERDEDIEIDSEYVERFAEDAREFGSAVALARIGHPSSFSAFNDDPEIQDQLRARARLMIPTHVRVDEDGFVRLYQ